MLSNSGLIRDDLYEVYQANAGSGMREVIEGVGEDAVLAQCMFDGKMMAIPRVNTSPGEEAPVLWLRTDWMEKLGLEDPQNWDDLYNIIKAFVEQDPDGNGQNDTIGLTFTKNLWDSGFEMDGLFNIFGSFPKANFWVEDPENPDQVIYGAFADETKTCLLYTSLPAQGRPGRARYGYSGRPSRAAGIRFDPSGCPAQWNAHDPGLPPGIRRNTPRSGRWDRRF